MNAVRVAADVRRIRPPDVARHEANELGAAPMNPFSHPMGEGKGEGLAVPIRLHEEDRTVTLTPALSHRMGEGDLGSR